MGLILKGRPSIFHIVAGNVWLLYGLGSPPKDDILRTKTFIGHWHPGRGVDPIHRCQTACCKVHFSVCSCLEARQTN